ncbi:MAG: rhodanese-like domain-containing protein [Pseudomonadota bacterium]
MIRGIGPGKTVFRMVRQSALILLLGIALGIGVNQVRRDRLAWMGEWSKGPAGPLLKTGKERLISIEESQRLFLHQGALFIDARLPPLYLQGHILGARNLPSESVKEVMNGVMADVFKDALIITYCEGERSFQSKALSHELISRGYENVRILENGWNQWVARELPVEAGARGGERG